MGRSEIYHVGIVVPRLEEAQERFTRLLGLEWGPIVETDVEVRDGDGRDLETRTKICFSTETPHIELIEEQPGTPWVCNEHSNLHHIGFFSDDLSAASSSWSTALCPFEYGSRPGSDPSQGWAYHRDGLGVRFECVGSSARPIMEEVLFMPVSTRPSSADD